MASFFFWDSRQNVKKIFYSKTSSEYFCKVALWKAVSDQVESSIIHRGVFRTVLKYSNKTDFIL